SPNTAPPNTAANTGNNREISVAPAICPAIGNKIANDPQDVPVEKAMNPAITKTITGKRDRLTLDDSTIPAKYVPVPRSSIKNVITQDKINIATAGNLDLAPSITPVLKCFVVSCFLFTCREYNINVVISPIIPPQNNAKLTSASPNIFINVFSPSTAPRPVK